MQLDRFEDHGMAVLLLYPEGRSFDVPRKLLSEDARVGDVFEARFTHDHEETAWTAAENKRLLDDLLGRGSD